VKCCRQSAKDKVVVSDDVKELIIGLRSFLQDSCEPPCYVSDRRLLKAINLLKVIFWHASFSGCFCDNFRLDWAGLGGGVVVGGGGGGLNAPPATHPN
jgi:hypothetical protein